MLCWPILLYASKCTCFLNYVALLFNVLTLHVHNFLSNPADWQELAVGLTPAVYPVARTYSAPRLGVNLVQLQDISVELQLAGYHAVLA